MDRNMHMSTGLPEIFIGSSSEAKDVSRAIEGHLYDVSNTTIWMNGVFRPGVSYLQSLLNALAEYDFAVLVLTPDDVLESRDASYSSPRDNVIFELGLFMGRLGPRRTFFIAEESASLRLPSDLSGISRLDYRRRENLTAAVSPACTELLNEIKKQGCLNHNFQESKNTAALIGESLSDSEQELRTIARSFFGSDQIERQIAAIEAARIGILVPLERILLLCASVVPGERVAATIALGEHIANDTDLASDEKVRTVIIHGLEDSRSRVRYRYVQFLRQLPSVALMFEELLNSLIHEEPNVAVRNDIDYVLSAMQSLR